MNLFITLKLRLRFYLILHNKLPQMMVIIILKMQFLYIFYIYQFTYNILL